MATSDALTVQRLVCRHCSARLEIVDPDPLVFPLSAELQCPACGVKQTFLPEPAVETEPPPTAPAPTIATPPDEEWSFARGVGFGLLLLGALALGWALRHFFG